MAIRCTVRPSPIHGQGVFIAEPISRRMKLGELTGVLIPLPQARRDQRGRQVIQMVEVSRRWALDCRHGNDFRLLNHSCRANCYLRVIRRRVEVYSRGPSPVGTELTVDYQETPHPGGMACTCGVPGCRSRL
jgi:SET domain-containing protein